MKDKKFVCFIKNKFIKSIRFRIFFALLCAGCVPAFFFRVSLLDNYEEQMVKHKMDRLQNQCNILRNHLVSENYLTAQTQSPTVNAELSQLSSMYDGRILIINEDYSILKDTYVMDENKYSIAPNAIKCFEGEKVSMYNSREHYIEFALPITSLDSQNIQGVMLVTFSTMDVHEEMESIEYKVSIIQLILFVVLVAFSFITSQYLVRPFKKIELAIDRMNAGHLEEKMYISEYSETMEISNAFNEAVDRMMQLEKSRQEFVSNVSHELKTPITSMKVLADSLLTQEDVPPELYQEFMADIVEEIDRENRLITDLLTLVKMDKNAARLNIVPINMNECIELILKRVRPIAEKKNIELVYESFRPVIAEVDEVKITIAISNLVENAVKYNVLDGWVRVSLNADHKYFYVKVADCGMGIPKEECDKVFERFYRVDKTRSRETGGSGLGLAITKDIVVLHKGDIKIHSKEGEGTTFTMRIPLSYIL